MSENMTIDLTMLLLSKDKEFIRAARKACANSIMNTATGAYLDEALQRLDRANALIDDIKAEVNCGGVMHVNRIYLMIEGRYKT